MDAASLTAVQRHRLLLAIATRRDWLGKLRDRMDAQGWAQDDAVYVAVRRAWDATHAAIVALVDSEPEEPAKPPAQPRPWMAPQPPVMPDGLPDIASMPWVGKRGKSRRRR